MRPEITFDDLLSQLPALGPWQLVPLPFWTGGAIRQCANNEICPWLAADHDGVRGSNGSLIDLAIWHAADNRPEHDAQIRVALLRACGLGE